jgi:zinc protease
VRIAAIAWAVTACACGGGKEAPGKRSGWEAAGIDWTRPPPPGPEPAFAPPVPVTFEIGAGIGVVLVENRRLPLVSVRIVNADAGARQDGSRLGLAALTAELLDEGAGDRDAYELAAAIEQLGATLDVAVAEDATVIWVDTLAATLDDSLAIAADVVIRPRFSAGEVDRVRAEALEDLRIRPQEPLRSAALLFDRITLAGHPYGDPPSGFLRTVRTLERRDVVRFWRDHYGPSAATIVVAGDVDRATLEASLTHHFGAWSGDVAGALAPPLPPPAPPGIAVIDRPGAPQSVVMLGRRGAAADDPDYFAAEVINTAIGANFASRLNRRLREELGYTYGMYAQFWRGEWAGTWSVSSSLATGSTVAGLRETLAILEAARTDELPADELARARQAMIRSLPQQFETNAGIAGELVDLVVKRLPLDWHQRYAAGVAAVTGASARAAAAAAWADVSIVVVGDLAAIGDDLATLGLPVRRHGAEGEALDAGRGRGAP